MSKQNNGGPAFPTSFSKDYPNEIVGGMTLRDYFAAKALPVLIDNIGTLTKEQLSEYSIHEACAIASYLYADAMLKARG